MKGTRTFPNIVLLVADALRVDRLHCYGNPWPTSPCMDRIAREGVMFRQLVAHSNHTLPGVGTIFTGLDPLSHGLIDPRTHIGHTWGQWKTPFSVIEENGFAFGAFDAYLYFHFGRHTHIETGAQAAPFFEENRDRPFFLWQFIEQVHLPYNPNPPYDTAFLPKDYRMSPEAAKRIKAVRSTMILHKPGLISQFELDQTQGRGNAFEADADRQIEYQRSAGSMTFEPEDRVPVAALYDGEVRTLDDLIAEYVNTLEELGLLDDTILIVTSDHGEELLERGSVGHASCSLAGTLYEEGIRVPLVIRYPKRLPKGLVVNRQICQTDIMPTILELAGLPMPSGMEGRSLLPLIESPRTPWVEETFGETLPAGWQTLKDDRRRMWFVRTPEWKLIFNQLAPAAPDFYELYHLPSDPGEKNNVAPAKPEIVERLGSTLRVWMSKELMRPLKTGARA